MKRFTLAVFMLMLFNVFALAQETITVTGRVTTGNGEAVPFATITVAGTTTATQADAQGNFTISARQGAQLVASAAGFQSQTLAVNGGTLNFTIQRGTGQLQEVVVTALGQRRTRNQVPYAAQQVTGEEVSRQRSTNFVNNLAGRVSGLELRQTNTLGGSTNVVIRGVKSLTGNNQALFVVDGVPFSNANTNTANQTTGRGGYDYGNAAADVNPDDIESITVLKGAAASALYGSRGSNGVILITTKKGRRGLGITLNTGVGVGSYDRSTFIRYQKEYGAGYGPFYEDPTGFFLHRDVDGDGVNDLVTPVTEDASYGARFDPNLMVYQWDAFDTTSPNYGKARPWVAAANDPSSFFRNSISSNHSLFLDGSSDKGSFKLGYTRNDDRGILPNSNIQKNLINFGGSYNVTDRLTASASVNFSNINGKGRYGTGYDANNLMTNFRQWWQTNVDVEDQKAAYFRTRRNTTWNWADPDDLVPIYWDNPYFTRWENFQTDNRDRYFGNVSANFKVTEWLNILGRIGLDSYDELQEERQAIGSINISGYNRFNRSFRETNFDLIANLDRDISEELNFKALIGTNIRKERTRSVNASTNGGLAIDRIYSLANTVYPMEAPVEFDGRREVDGYFAGATLSWRDMLTLDATIRRDQSSTLPEGNNTYYYPSVSLGYAFSRLLPTATWLSYGKVRANYAEVGNDAPLYSVLDVYTITPAFGISPTSTVPNVKNNPELMPERTKSAEFGIEMAFLKNRLGFDATYYRTRTVDQILPLAVSTATGYSSKFLNAGTIENKGIELSAFGTPIQTRDFSWNVNLNWTRNRNKVVELFEGADNLVLATFQGGVSLNATLGQPYGTIRGSNFVYTNGQKTVDADGYYLFSETSNEIIGNPNPDWTGGINNALRFKNLSLSWLVDWRKGGDVYSLDMAYGLYTGVLPETAGLNELGNPKRDPVADGGGVINEGVTEDGKENTTRIDVSTAGTLGEDAVPSAGFVYDASYVKLREVQFTYSLPSALVSRLRAFKGVDVSLIGRNLWIIHKNLPYADPEETLSSGNLQGYQGGAYPSVRTFNFNLRFRF
jgi:TonB-linked SusC/RagA family outer membrane protein